MARADNDLRERGRRALASLRRRDSGNGANDSEVAEANPRPKVEVEASEGTDAPREIPEFEPPPLEAADGPTQQILERAHEDPGPLELPRVLAIANQKGVVG
ncbi:MAG TPA: hypothetical protein VMN37_08210, partial [Gemmatimonadales bacterium]|nr:hypothetical protein [Gemmatimonadales bacterium]